MVPTPVPKPAPGNYNSIAAQYARAKAAKDADDKKKVDGILRENGILERTGKPRHVAERLNEFKAGRFTKDWGWVVGFFVWMLFIHISGIYFFTKGFLLTRLVLDSKSTCAEPPISISKPFKGAGTPEGGCWHPKTFDKAVVIIIDALRYDFTVPFNNISQVGASNPMPAQAYHNSIPFLYDTAIAEPHNAFLLPFIADPPTTTLQRLKGLTTGTLPTFIDAGSNFAGEAIKEDNLLQQLRDAGRKIVHLGDDTWTALFPGYFEEGISKAYDSLNVWDLHTVDTGVTEHILPLLASQRKDEWDVMFAHFLGVDHAGHRYGPNHPAMTMKLQQMNGLMQEIVQNLDDNTLLVVMGDHGMDGKGDHGGESDDEVQAALWMYSKKGIFGRTDPSFVTPPQNAKIRPVNQIDLVPTLALSLGLPIPFNNLGRPIEEAFVGKKGNAWDNLAGVSRMAAAGIKRYQAAYYDAQGINESTIDGSPHDLWGKAEGALISGNGKEQMLRGVYTNFSAFQEETLRICRDLWARFDVPSMILGISILAAGVVALVFHANDNAEADTTEEDIDLEMKERDLELKAISDGKPELLYEENASRSAVKGAIIGTAVGVAAVLVPWGLVGGGSMMDFAVGGGSIGGLVAVLFTKLKTRLRFSNPLPRTVWGWLAAIFTISQSIGFASNSYTIWEDSILLFFITTFGLAAAISSIRIEKHSDRVLAIYHSAAFVALGWIASSSKLCREEQMPWCRSTYYASANSSTSAPWQLLILFIVAAALPSIIKSYYVSSRNYEGFAPVWISWAFRTGLILCAIFWTIDAADDSEWFTGFSSATLKTLRTPIAQTIFAVSIGAGSLAFGSAPPCVSISSSAAPTPGSQITSSSGATVTILGFANTHGSRYFLLVVNVLLAILMVQKPMGAGAIALMSWQILSLLEILDLNTLTSSPIGPVVLALLGSFHFFKTGHQATLSSIQWESAFIPLHTIRYPWSPLLVALNSFGAQILAVSAVPLVALWKQKPRKKGILQSVAAALAWHALYYAVVGLATTMWAGHLRRHLMLYRIFCPKFMTAAAVLVIVDVVGLLVALMGVRWNTISIGEVFGWR
ncbi:Glycosylphosphatidylinositol-anchor biosynthesis 13 [Hyphodiscus hymeniophilus]|uniref:Glycosylphosphatidylinositol-anchor biosynthesis 13 n=1 Tax=Hyphodiscus hymeniophilus TaxID=353542 RepID=A0A9P7AWQ6_9HELO|nr:Glycosylphosphatidylinositol-anchor biosynthesis 13 [Hyphodiscus hymeniophilus]